MDVNIMELIGNIGLPGVLCLLMMTKYNKAIENNTAAINALAVQLAKKEDKQ